MQLRVSPPNVKVGVPKVDVKVDSPQLNMDSSQFAEAVSELAATMRDLAIQQQQILQTIVEHHNVLNQMVGNQPSIKVDAPVVKMPPRPREFDIVFVEDEGGVVGMKVRANLPN